MPKLVNSTIKFKGKLDEKVYVDSIRYGHHVRMAQKPGARKDDPNLKLQQRRNKNLNGLASSIRLTINNAYHDLYKSDLYFRLLKQIRKERSDSRSFLLLRLKGMEINLNYKLLGDYKITVTPKSGKVLVNLEVRSAPHNTRLRAANSYYYDMILFTWDSTNGPLMASRDSTEWVYMEDGEFDFEFEFIKPKGAIHWMVALRMQLGIDGIDGHPEMETYKAQGAQFLDTGSFNKKEQALLDKRWMEIQEQKNDTGPDIPKPVITHRVKAKKRGNSKEF